MATPVLIILFMIGGIVLVVDQLRRLVSFIVLNKTIRAAMEHQPESVPTLLAKLEVHPTLSSSAIGACLTVIGFGIALLSLATDMDERRPLLTIAIAPILIGVTLVAAARWAGRSTRP